jgi:hypothetical protein
MTPWGGLSFDYFFSSSMICIYCGLVQFQGYFVLKGLDVDDHPLITTGEVKFLSLAFGASSSSELRDSDRSGVPKFLRWLRRTGDDLHTELSRSSDMSGCVRKNFRFIRKEFGAGGMNVLMTCFCIDSLCSSGRRSLKAIS